MPSGEKAYIKSLEVDDEPMEWAVAGRNVVLNLTDIDAVHLKIGNMLCSPASPVQNIASFTAKVLVRRSSRYFLGCYLFATTAAVIADTVDRPSSTSHP